MTNTTKITTGFIAGTILGATLGLLFAPKNGVKTRAMIADKAREIGVSVGENYKKAKEKMGISSNAKNELVS